MSLTNYTENKILDHIVGKTSFTRPNVYGCLFTANPGESGTITSEPSGGSYARVLIADAGATTDLWGTAASGRIANASDIIFPESTGSWGTLAYAGIIDSATLGAGNLLASGGFKDGATYAVTASYIEPRFVTDVFEIEFTSSNFSDYLNNKILAHITGKTAYSMPTMYVGLSTTDPASVVTEPSGGSYARVATSGATWNAATGGAIDNASDVVFPQATASWGDVAYAVFYDAASSGNLLAHKALLASVTVGSGFIFVFQAGDIIIGVG